MNVNAKTTRVVTSVFGKIRMIETIRTDLLFVFPYGDITVPDIELGGDLRFCAVRVPDDNFYEGCYWANYGPKPTDGDPDVFVLPVVIKPWAECMCANWARVVRGDFVTTESGVIVLDVDSLFAWEGYDRPGKRNYNFDRRRLEKSAVALKVLAGNA